MKEPRYFLRVKLVTENNDDSSVFDENHDYHYGKTWNEVISILGSYSNRLDRVERITIVNEVTI